LWTPKDKRSYDQFLNRLTAHFFLLDRMGINYSKSIFELKASLRPAPRGNGVVLKLIGRVPHSETRFSNAENPLTGFSPIFPDSINIDRPLQINAAIFEGPARRSPIWRQYYEISKSSGKPITLAHPPHASYNNGGAFTLNDGVLGRLPWNGAEWLGWQGDSLNATIDLTLPMDIARIRVDALADESSWIYLPKSVDVYISSDSISWTKLTSLRSDDIQKFKRTIDIRFTKTTARYVNIRAQGLGKIPDGKPGAGENAWLFIDEILID
jgi:hexosaminidase